jgi:hypothetical protein
VSGNLSRQVFVMARRISDRRESDQGEKKNADSQGAHSVWWIRNREGWELGSFLRVSLARRIEPRSKSCGAYFRGAAFCLSL